MTDNTEQVESPEEEAPAIETDETPEFSEEEVQVIQAEVDRRETVIHDLVNAAIDGQPADFMSVFDKEVKHRLQDIIAQDKIDIQASMIGGGPQEEVSNEEEQQEESAE